MGKAGWQVTAAIFASLSVMLGAAAWNTKRSLEVANADLAKASSTIPAPVADPFKADPITGELPPETVKWMDGTECRGGVLIRKTSTGWESLTDANGKAVTCEHVYEYSDGKQVRWK